MAIAMTAQKVLVVDDEDHILELARLYLSREGYQIETVADGAQALAAEAQAGLDAALDAGQELRRRRPQGAGAAGTRRRARELLETGPQQERVPGQVVAGARHLELLHEVASQRPAQGEAHRDDRDRRQQQTDPEAQLSAISSLYPTPQTVWIVGLVTPPAVSFSRSCWTWTSTVRV